MHILIIDDHEVVRDGIKRIFEEDVPPVEFSEAATYEQALQHIENRTFDIVILDITIGQRSGLELLLQIRKRRPELPILVLSMHTEQQYALRSFQLGAAGYVTKGSSRSNLREAVQKLLRGGRYASEVVAEQLLREVGRNRPMLSNREFEVMRLLGAGRTVGEVAGILGLSDKTVSTYRSRILAKLGLKSTPELIHYAVQNHLLG